MEKEERMLLAAIDDKKEQCERRYAPVNTTFLDVHQRAIAESFCKGDKEIILLSEHADGTYDNPDVKGTGRLRAFFYGGYSDAERRLLVFLPEYAEIEEVVPQGTSGAEATQKSGSVIEKETIVAPEDCPLAVLKVRTSKGSRKLTHRDYLGSMLSLGIKREMTGDIIVYENGADIIILKEIADFLLMNYEKAGRTSLSLEITDISKLDVGNINIEEKSDTVASLRLDGLVSSVFGLSRGKAQEAIKAGLVFVNSAAAMKPDMQLEEGDKLVLRGRGKAVLREIAGRTRKDRIYIKFDKYI